MSRLSTKAKTDEDEGWQMGDDLQGVSPRLPGLKAASQHNDTL